MSVHRKEEQETVKTRRNITLPQELDDWLASDEIGNASGLITDLLMAYRAYGNAERAIQYVNQRENRNRRP